MTANVSIVTLGVENLAASTDFYVKLGWINSSASQESVTFLQGHSVVLGLYEGDPWLKMQVLMQQDLDFAALPWQLI